MDNFCAAGAGRAMLPRMSFEDLPKDWPARPLDDVSVGASVVDLCVSDRDRGVGGLSVLLCRTDRTLSQPVFVEDVPGSELCEVVARMVEAGSHLPGVGGVVVSVVRPWGAVTDLDHAAHQSALEACRGSGIPLLGMYVVTRASVTHLPLAEGLELHPGGASRDAPDAA